MWAPLSWNEVIKMRKTTSKMVKAILVEIKFGLFSPNVLISIEMMIFLLKKTLWTELMASQSVK